MSERDDYRGDVWYAEWRAGLPEDSVSVDQIDQAYDDGCSAESLVQEECERRAERRARREYAVFARQDEEMRVMDDREAESEKNDG